MSPEIISTTFNGSTSSPEESAQQIEAARYAVLRRLAPCLRHHMMRPLQPIGLIYGVMHHKLSAPQPDLQSVHDEADKINDFVKAALDECIDMNSWIAPEPGVMTEVDAGVTHCVSLLATMLHFCGFHLNNEVEKIPERVQRDVMRMVLNAALLEMTDSLAVPCTVTISAAVGQDDVTLSLQVSQTREGSVERYDDGYRNLVWRDVQALAAAGNVGVTREDGRVTLCFVTEPAVLVPIH
ncbi:MAG: hypothetical protein ABIQ90_04950 [Polaromonas sp.]